MNSQTNQLNTKATVEGKGHLTLNIKNSIDAVKTLCALSKVGVLSLENGNE